MNKKELIDAIAEKANISKKEAGEVLDATLDVIKEAVAKDDKVHSTIDFHRVGIIENRHAPAAPLWRSSRWRWAPSSWFSVSCAPRPA